MASPKKTEYRWSRQKSAGDVPVVECPAYDPYKDFRRDPSGYYVLIKIEWDRLRIAAAVCDKEHRIVKVFRGRSAQDLYHTIFAQEKKDKAAWLTDKDHIAYLGKELKKAEIALALGNSGYYQE